MRKLIASTFASLDGIMQAPGGPEEDPTGVVMSTYVPGSEVQPGSFAAAEPSDKELARRTRMANGTW